MLTGFESSASTINDHVDIRVIKEEESNKKIIEVQQPEVSDVTHVYSLDYTEEEIELLALLTMAEAEGECEEGKRLVISTVLNRVDHPYFPDTINDVIYQSGQFEAMWNGRVNRCVVTEEVRQLVIDEMISRTNSEVMYFNAIGYPSYGKKLFKVGNHYFAAY